MGWKTQNKVVTYKSHSGTYVGLSTFCSEPRPELRLPVLREVSPFTGPLVGLGYPVLERSDFFLVVFFFCFPFTCVSWTKLYAALGPVVQDQSSTV